MRLGFVALSDRVAVGIASCAGMAAQGAHVVAFGVSGVIGFGFRFAAARTGIALQLLPSQGVFDVVLCPSLFAGTGDEAVTDEEGPGDS